eukprot:CAMPEP_0114266396 /NCGR_PEP_ID=MMETSP0058-20121206/24590_1 /TAXON_ID=36894 /ORGANISM="Pyramimonas parkeae, CCMP726" /LENGTH=193 /DNA_ID=CAMNT_0001383879 /DNA_START=257 /DNA_END=838 /DNA_ORIENTATION=-
MEGSGEMSVVREPYVVPQNSPLALLAPDGNREGSDSEPEGWVLEDEHGKPADLSVLRGKMVGLYFSASWCPPCRTFSPQLAYFAEGHADDFVVVFVSSDHSEQEMRDYVKGKGFYRVRFNSSVRHQLVQYLGVNMLPTLVVCNADSGNVITTWGRMALMMNQQHCLQDWRRGLSGISLTSMLGLNSIGLNCMG